MSIRENIEKQYKQSIIEKKSSLTNTLRLIKSAIKDKDIAARSSKDKEVIKDTEILNLLQTLIKQRNDSIDSFKSANRKDLIEKEEQEIEIISSFLPKQLDQNETENIISNLIQEKNYSSIKDMGNIMQDLKSKYSGKIDMSLAGKISKSKLTS
ncbi:MAG: glutamyl-tRNA amidotransferase [Rickettsiales bacterium]|nr:glutamyl-tRNA amidotransferase [Rickettsiales bacterium]|tara:strand:+ start:1342 stop:1803 length:462 start_codon:yes stop_codon:yes gene_type:complete